LKRHERLAEVQKQIAALRRELKENQEISDGLAARRRAIDADLKQLENTAAQLAPVELTVTDHAVVRYLERHCGFDVRRLRQEIADLLQGFADANDAEVCGFKIKGKTVVTFIGAPKEVTIGPELQRTE
jgi:ATP-dependent Clp protease ATP-binding subunit ClpA